MTLLNGFVEQRLPWLTGVVDRRGCLVKQHCQMVWSNGGQMALSNGVLEQHCQTGMSNGDVKQRFQTVMLNGVVEWRC